MLWLKIDINLPTHTKVADIGAKAGAIAGWLYLGGIAYCRQKMTDGYIPKAAVPTLAVGMPKNVWPFAEALVAAGLWDHVVGGYQVHDYLSHNPSKADIQSKRESDAHRQHRSRSRHAVTDAVTPNGQPCDSHARVTRAGAPAVSPSVSGSGVSGDESAREGAAPPVWNPHGPPSRRASLLPTHHRCHVWTHDACAMGLCVPAFLAEQWIAQFRGDHERAEREIRAVISSAADTYGDGPIGADGKEFWRAAWKARYGGVVPERTTRGMANAAAIDEAFDGLERVRHGRTGERTRADAPTAVGLEVAGQRAPSQRRS